MTRTAPLSVQLYSLRDQLAADQNATLQRLAELGFRYVEPFGLGSPEKPYIERLAAARSLRKALDAAGLTVSAVHAAVPPRIAELAEECAVLETRTVIIPHPKLVPGFDAGTFTDADRVDAFAGTITELAQHGATHGLQLGYHNHWFEWARMPDGTPGWDRFWSRAGENVLAEVDLYWAATAGADPAGVLAALGTRVISVHLKDGPARTDQPQTPLGTGKANPVPALERAGSSWWHVTEIDTTEHDPYELLYTNAQYLVASGLSRWS